MSKSDSDILKQYKKYIVTNTMIDDYHAANRKNAQKNKKAKRIKYAQWILFAGVFTVIIPLILLPFT